MDALRHKLQTIDAAIHLVEPRILRRVIRLDRRLPGFGLSVLRRQSYTIERDRLLAYVERSELEDGGVAELPRLVILIAKPDDDAFLDLSGERALLLRYARLVYNALVKVELQGRLAQVESEAAWADERRQAIGELAFAELRSVMAKDEYLFAGASDAEAYIEFAALYLELRSFAPQQLMQFFPAIRDWEAIAALVGRDVVDAEALERRCRTLLPADFQEPPSAVDRERQRLAENLERRSTITLAEFRRRQADAERLAALGNSVKAAVLHARAALVAPTGHVAEAETAAQLEMFRLVKRLQVVLGLSPEVTNDWSTALLPLLLPAAEGYWANEARLLYDLQKVCVEQERGVYRLDLIEWIRTRGERPVRRPLPLLRDALMLRHLRTAKRRLTSARIEAADRERLSALLADVVERVEDASRNRLRPVFDEVFDEVGLTPQNVPESVARRKLIEELLDRIVENSYITMAELRDALSKNDLKLPDVLSVGDLAGGDRLLRADKSLDRRLDGVYRRGAVYQRWPQTISSLAFGTRFGRFVTRHLALPFGGAYLAVEFVLHLAHLFDYGQVDHESAAHAVAHSAKGSLSAWLFYGSVVLLGTWLSLLLHQPAFRQWNLRILESAWRLTRKLFLEWPAQILQSEIVERIRNSQAFATVHNYALRPGALAGMIYGVLFLSGHRWSDRGIAELYLVCALVLNSSVGRYVTELSTDVLVRIWHELRIRVIGAVLQWIVDIFHGLMVALERVVYMVDEWLRFRAGDSRAMQGVKLIGGVVWFFVAYVVVFVFTLLVEPQVNPIKHFPVVTVSHKLILPTGPVFVGQLSKYIGKAWANTVVWTTIWLIPGVFGFLVWELKENWRLYASNRRRALRPIAIGSHGETMLRLLRPGFHSGTLPKAFAALRRAARKSEQTANVNSINRRAAAIHHVEQSVRNFVERELLHLLEDARIVKRGELTVRSTHAATNSIEVVVGFVTRSDEHLNLRWQEHEGRLSCELADRGLLAVFAERNLIEQMELAFAGLLQRSGAERVETSLPPALAPIEWTDWVAAWRATGRNVQAAEPAHRDSDVASTTSP